MGCPEKLSDNLNFFPISPMFQFKQFVIHQEHTPMKVGTDGVLLGAWAELEEATSILDIGTGTGLLSLMAAQRNAQARIDALEIEPAACREAAHNIQISPWAERIRLYPQALQAFFPAIGYDCILCNPPFFVDSTPAPDCGRSLARHADTLPHSELIVHADRLLTPHGKLQVILPVEEARQFITYAGRYHLFPRKITRVHPNPGKAPKRLLLQLTRQSLPPVETDLVIELSRHQYSKEYIALTRKFYLKME